MKRLKRVADYYDEYKEEDLSVSKEKLMKQANKCCEMYDIDESTISISENNDTYVQFGDYDTNGFVVVIQFNNSTKGAEVNRIILSVSKDFPGKLHYVETREQLCLDNFLNNTNDFYNWMEESVNRIEDSEQK